MRKKRTTVHVIGMQRAASREKLVRSRPIDLLHRCGSSSSSLALTQRVSAAMPDGHPKGVSLSFGGYLA